MRVTRLRISLITPSYNQAQFIERAIASVLCQTGPFDLEYLASDAGSKEGRWRILNNSLARPRWRARGARGKIAAITTGRRGATAGVVAWLIGETVFVQGRWPKSPRC